MTICGKNSAVKYCTLKYHGTLNLSILCSNHEILGFKKMFQYPLMTNERACESAIELTLKCYERTLAIMRVEVEYFHSILKMIEFSIQTIRVPSY